jgi:transcriptional regulator with XRE-family HTH domain
MTDKFDGVVRTKKVVNDDELRASLKGGWDNELPAIKDENGLLLVGNRRMKIAEEEKIKPVIKVVKFGTGPEADAARRRLANVSNIGGALLSVHDRKRQAKQLYESDLTQAAIAHMLGVSQSTIRNDLADLVDSTKSKEQPKTATNPKGSGRRKGGGKKPTAPPKAHPKHDLIVAAASEGKSQKEVAIEVGVNQRVVRRELERDAIARVAKAEPDVSRADLSMTAQEKFDAAVRQYQRKLGLQFEQRVHDEVKRRIDEIVLPHWQKQIDQAKTLYERRRALMDKETFNTIRRALHPDSRNAISDKKLSEAFDTFMGLEKYLINEKDSPTSFGHVPSSLAEWDAMRQRAKAERKRSKNAVARR